MKCKLCKETEANKTGSHIVPHFLMKRIDNQFGSKERDKELGFIISEKGSSSYFGRAVSPESLQETYGDISDELIEKNINPHIEDYILCTKCEKKLAVVEDYYSKTLKVYDFKKRYYTSSDKPFICLLFWLSIIWRLSIAKRSGFQLIRKHEKRLRRILRQYLSENINEIWPKRNDKDLYQIGYKLYRCPNYSDGNSTLLFCHPDYVKPYFFIIDEYVLTLNFATKFAYINSKIVHHINTREINIVHNTPLNGETIIVIKPKIYKYHLNKFNVTGAKRWLNNLSKELNYIHKMMGGKGDYMPKQLQEEIAQEIIRDKVPKGTKYTQEHKNSIIKKVMNKHFGSRKPK